jgi:hypothetical protein
MRKHDPTIQGTKVNKNVMKTDFGNALNDFGNEMAKLRKTLTPEAYQKLVKELDKYITFKEQGN